jgi:hypothetical protein
MRFLLSPALAVVLLTGSVGANAVATIGEGLQSCGSWTAARRDRQSFGVETWIFGYLSGAAFALADEGYDPVRGTDAAGILAWIDCLAHPLEPLTVAGGTFVVAHPR